MIVKVCNLLRRCLKKLRSIRNAIHGRFTLILASPFLLIIRRGTCWDRFGILQPLRVGVSREGLRLVVMITVFGHVPRTIVSYRGENISWLIYFYWHRGLVLGMVFRSVRFIVVV